MPEHLRALCFILPIAWVVFLFAKKTIIPNGLVTPQDFNRRRNLWFALTLSAFLAHNFWIFAAVAAVAILILSRDEPNKAAMHFAVLVCLPRLTASISGGGLVKELFALDPLRILALLILVPVWWQLRKRPDVEPFGKLLVDKIMIVMFALEIVLTLPERTLPSVLRDSVFYAFTNVFLLYYVSSRSLRSIQHFRESLSMLTAGLWVFCAIVAFEFLRRWLLYSSLERALGVSIGDRGYLIRSGMLRAEGTAGQSIIAGYVAAVGIGIFLYVRTLIQNPWMRRAGMALMFAGIVGAFARGPWVGGVAIIMVFLLLGPSPFGSIGKLAGAILLSLPVLLTTDAGLAMIDHLPWIGTVDARNVDFRENLFDVAIRVILQYPFFGNYDFATIPEIESLRGSDGIIDVVNTYIMIALRGGIVSLTVFVLLVAAAMWGVFMSLLKLDKHDERHVLGRALLATMVGVLVTIATVSPIFLVYPLYWCLTGLMVGFTQLVARGEPVRKQVGAGPVGAVRPVPQPLRTPGRATWR
ncbi:hypothetical protein [Piscinibacter gummiphilus]|uniref:O-antigen ligase domain-containing protein n=1 Tax=Piscinibacter gummiphilus TaxID=946333 RepID=A0ABZ0CQN9_9BURK|nr:hypothetical protein [Piscinibacter gummiphilus]WOB07300.1 hypothetical protein RXV79_20560 [Piscinibacter gummiphilus]